MKRIKPILFLTSIFLFATACQKNANFDELSLNPTCITSKSPNANFKEHKTFYISDTIHQVTNDPADTIMFDNNAKKLIDAIVSNMTRNGYTRTTIIDSADLGISTLLMSADVTQTVYYSGWWGGYYGGYYGGGYWGYPGYGYYYPYGTTYSYSIGTFIYSALDLKNAPSKNMLEAIWTGYLVGYLADNVATNVSRGVDGINQSFKQSTYFTNR